MKVKQSNIIFNNVKTPYASLEGSSDKPWGNLPIKQVVDDGGNWESENIIRAVDIDWCEPQLGNVDTANGAMTTGDLLNHINNCAKRPVSKDLDTTLYVVGTNTDGELSYNNKVSFNDSGMYHSSDIRLKENIDSIDEDIIETIFGIDTGLHSFNYKGSDKRTFGLIAQDVELYAPEALEIDNDGYYKVNYDAVYGKLIAALLHKVKKLEEKVDDLENRLCEVEGIPEEDTDKI